MSNELQVILTDVDQDAKKVLSFLTGAEKKVASAGPKVVAGLGVLLGAAAKAVTDGGAAAAADGINISLDVATFNDVKAVWPDIVAWGADFGIKL